MEADPGLPGRGFAVTRETGRFEPTDLPAGRHAVGVCRVVLLHREGGATAPPIITLMCSGIDPAR